jgi:peptidoglycan/xylan/chitin deacetylase (PgdA/CDA1 family)
MHQLPDAPGEGPRPLVRYHPGMAGKKDSRSGDAGSGRPPAKPRGGRPERTVYSSGRGKSRSPKGSESGRRRRAGAYASMSAEERRSLQRRVWMLRVAVVLLLAIGVLLLAYFTVGRRSNGGAASSPSPAASSPVSQSPSASATAVSATPTPSASPSVAQLPPSARSRPVPILMYHVLASPPAGARNPSLFVSIADFTAQVRWLHSHGYHSVSLTQVFDFWAGTGGLPVKPIVFSFDDGYRSDWAVGGRVLSRYGYAGVLNLKVGNIMPKGGITPQQVNWLLDLGWELAAHTINHLDLTTLGAAQLAYEVGGSRHALQKQFHVPVDFFCYPSGRFDARAVAAVRAAGFRGATTTVEGLATRGDDPYELPRIRVDGGESLQSFASLLTSR